MPLASDQNSDPSKLSRTSQRILELRDVALAEWEKRVRAEIDESGQLPRPVLIDTIPSFYDNLAEAITESYPRTTATDGASIATAHGNERARLTPYDASALVREYQIFRWVVFDTLHHHGVTLTKKEAQIIGASVDGGIREALAAFSSAHTALRQQFIAALTHDLRNPLAVVRSSLELILLTPDPAKMRTIAFKAMDNLDRIDHMIQELLDSMAFHAGKRITLQPIFFDVADVVKEVQSQETYAHSVQFQIFGESVKGWWDLNAIKRAVENLVSNAVKYGDTSKPVRITFTEAYERLLLMVHNCGEPIPQEEQESVFQIFRRAQNAKGAKTRGWGIGLPFVRAVAESHGGKVAIDSSHERGTTFILDIPVDSRPFQESPTLAQKE
jgi:signal transduction histidine kinase